MKKAVTVAAAFTIAALPGTANAYTRTPTRTVATVQIVSATQTCVNGNVTGYLTVKNNRTTVFREDTVWTSGEFTYGPELTDGWADIAPGETVTIEYHPSGNPSEGTVSAADFDAGDRVVASREIPAPDCVTSW